jgi:hypothetical protein
VFEGGVLSSVIQRRVVRGKLTEVSDKRITYNFFTVSSMLASCLAYSSALKMEAVYASETSIDFHRTISTSI